MTEKYNGWKNYETWSINLFIDNDEALLNQVLDLTKEQADKSETNARYDLSHAIKDLIEEWLEIENLNPYQTQMITASLSEVDYYEIADAKLKEGVFNE